MADESKSNHLVLLKPFGNQNHCIMCCAYLQTPKLSFTLLKVLYLKEANLKPKVLCTNHYSAANGDALNS
jgi:hypothetical protein